MKSCCDEYCSTHGCNQGRDCPVRKPVAEAPIVARIGRKDYAREPLPPSIWRAQLRVLSKWMLIAWAIVFYVALVAALLT